MARDNSCTVNAPGLGMRPRSVRVLPHCLRAEPPHTFPPSFQTCTSCGALHDVSRFAFKKLCQCNENLWVYFQGDRACLDVVNVYDGCFLLCCPVVRVSGRREHCSGQVLKLERPVPPGCGCGVDGRQLRKCYGFDEGFARSWFRGATSPRCRRQSRSNTNIQEVCQLCRLTLRRRPLSLSLGAARLPPVSTVAAVLAVETAACCWRFVATPSIVVSIRLDSRCQWCSICNTRRCYHPHQRIPTRSNDSSHQQAG